MKLMLLASLAFFACTPKNSGQSSTKSAEQQIPGDSPAEDVGEGNEEEEQPIWIRFKESGTADKDARIIEWGRSKHGMDDSVYVWKVGEWDHSEDIYLRTGVASSGFDLKNDNGKCGTLAVGTGVPMTVSLTGCGLDGTFTRISARGASTMTCIFAHGGVYDYYFSSKELVFSGIETTRTYKNVTVDWYNDHTMEPHYKEAPMAFVNMDYRGSDGASEYIYPFTVHRFGINGDRTGGCFSDIHPKIGNP